MNTLVGQNGAPLYFNKNVKKNLDDIFAGPGTTERGRLERIPDLTPLDHILCGYLKYKVYQNNIRSRKQN